MTALHKEMPSLPGSPGDTGPSSQQLYVPLVPTAVRGVDGAIIPHELGGSGQDMQSPSHDETRYFQALVQEAETFLSAVWTRLREAREARGWSMEKTAELLGVDEKTYKHWERKRHHPQFDHFQALVELFGLEALTSHQERAFLAFLARLDGATRKAFYQYLAALPDLAWMRQFLKYVEQLPRDEQIP